MPIRLSPVITTSSVKDRRFSDQSLLCNMFDVLAKVRRESTKTLKVGIIKIAIAERDDG